MTLSIVARRIGDKERLFDTERTIIEMRHVLSETEQAMLKDFRAVTATWEHEVEFETLLEFGSDAIVQVGTSDPIFRYLDEGTRVRYATMSPDYKAKTRPRVLRSYPGQGEMLFVNTNKPMPGIQAREFSETIEKKHLRSFERRVDRVIDRASKRSGL